MLWLILSTSNPTFGSMPPENLGSDVYPWVISEVAMLAQKLGNKVLREIMPIW